MIITTDPINKLIQQNIIKRLEENSFSCTSGILMCYPNAIGIYTYDKCFCANKIHICDECAKALAENIDKENLLIFTCPTCRRSIQLTS